MGSMMQEQHAASIKKQTANSEQDPELEGALEVMTDASAKLNPTFTRAQNRHRAIAWLEYLWERGWVVVSATHHVLVRLRLGIFGMVVGLLAGFWVGVLYD
jgi:hypothetical protein